MPRYMAMAINKLMEMLVTMCETTLKRTIDEISVDSTEAELKKAKKVGDDLKQGWKELTSTCALVNAFHD